MFFCSMPGSDLHLEIHTDLRPIAIEWNSRLPENHPLQSSFWIPQLKSGLSGISFRFVQIFRGKKWIGQAAFQLITISGKAFQITRLESQLKNWLLEKLKNRESMVMVCGNLLFQQHPGFYFENNRDKEEIIAVARKLMNVEKAMAKPSAILIKDWESDTVETRLPSGFQFYKGDAAFEMEIDPLWRRFSDYQNQLSKKYFQRSQKIRNAGSEISRKKLTAEEIKFYAQEISDSYLQVLHKQPFRPVHLNADYFFQMQESLGTSFEVWGYFMDETLAGFSSYFLKPGKTLEMHFVGFDGMVNKSHFLYFNMLFDGLEKAIESGIRKLLLGRGGNDAKSSLGAVQKSISHIFWIERGINKLVFNTLSSQIGTQFNSGVIERNPFKGTKAENPIRVGNQIAEAI